MKIRLLTPRADATGSQNIGDEIEVSADEARRMIEAGQAVPVRGAAPETATARRKSEKAAR